MIDDQRWHIVNGQAGAIFVSSCMSTLNIIFCPNYIPSDKFFKDFNIKLQIKDTTWNKKWSRYHCDIICITNYIFRAWS